MDSNKKILIWDNIPFTLDVQQVINQMHVHGDTRRYEAQVRKWIDITLPIARPKALCKICCIDKKEPEALEIDGVKFVNRLLRDNLDKLETVFVCVATAGTEVETLKIPDNVIERFCLDAIKNMILFSASNYFQNYLVQHFISGELSNMNPGEAEAFPIDQQKKLFSILGDVEGMIGVKLTENCAMIPLKSTSGIYFSKETKFIGCLLCTHKRCQGRKAAFNPELAKQYQK